MEFEITYVDGRPNRIVDDSHFERSSAFYRVLLLPVGGVITNRYHSAGYKQIRRIS